MDSPAVPGSTSSQLQAMTCAGAGDCWAVGYYADASGADHTLIEHDTGGGWTVVSSPTPAGDGDINPDGVPCASADECWAVGYSDTSGPNSTGVGVIEEYTGSGWTIVTGPSASGGRTDELAAVNREQCHWRSMTDMARRTEAGEFIAVSARRVRDLPDVREAVSWLSDRRLDSRTGVSVGTDDVVRRAPARAQVYW